jgi:acyl-CoA-binding protein
MSTQADFDAAIVNVTKLKKTPSDNERLKVSR